MDNNLVKPFEAPQLNELTTLLHLYFIQRANFKPNPNNTIPFRLDSTKSQIVNLLNFGLMNMFAFCFEDVWEYNYTEGRYIKTKDARENFEAFKASPNRYDQTYMFDSNSLMVHTDYLILEDIKKYNISRIGVNIALGANISVNKYLIDTFSVFFNFDYVGMDDRFILKKEISNEITSIITIIDYKVVSIRLDYKMKLENGETSLESATFNCYDPS